MKAFMYLVEIILVALLLLTYLAYINPNTSPKTYIDKLSKDYKICTLCSSLSKILNDELGIEDITTLTYLSLNNVLKDFSQKIKRYDFIEMSYNMSYKCLAFLYPFPNMEDYGFLENDSAYFLVESYDGIPCSFSASRDWILVELPNISNANISLYLPYLSIIGRNLSNLDMYSVFVFDSLGNSIKINYIASDTKFLNISLSPTYELSFIKPPFYILFRIKENSTFSNLNYLGGRYTIVSSLKGTIVKPEDIEISNWLTIYVDTSCIKDGFLVLEYDIFPNKYTKLSNINPSTCYPPNKVIYYKNTFFEYLNSKSLENLKLTNRPKSFEHTCDILKPNGLSLMDFRIYGS